MTEQLRGPFEKCAAVMLLCLPLHNSITAAHRCQSTSFSNGPSIRMKRPLGKIKRRL